MLYISYVVKNPLKTHDSVGYFYMDYPMPKTRAQMEDFITNATNNPRLDNVRGGGIVLTGVVELPNEG